MVFSQMIQLLLLVLLVGCATAPASVRNDPEPSIIVVRDPMRILAMLRERREEVDRAGPDELVDRGRDLDLGPLVGLRQEQVFSVLGRPQSCDPAVRVSGTCGPELWEYAMYHLPQTAIGGGTMLLFRFDSTGRCDVARWSGRK